MERMAAGSVSALRGGLMVDDLQGWSRHKREASAMDLAQMHAERVRQP